VRQRAIARSTLICVPRKYVSHGATDDCARGKRCLRCGPGRPPLGAAESSIPPVVVCLSAQRVRRTGRGVQMTLTRRLNPRKFPTAKSVGKPNERCLFTDHETTLKIPETAKQKRTLVLTPPETANYVNTVLTLCLGFQRLPSCPSSVLLKREPPERDRVRAGSRDRSWSRRSPGPVSRRRALP
jgi:hypothetical protein